MIMTPARRRFAVDQTETQKKRNGYQPVPTNAHDHNLAPEAHTNTKERKKDMNLNTAITPYVCISPKACESGPRNRKKRDENKVKECIAYAVLHSIRAVDQFVCVCVK